MGRAEVTTEPSLLGRCHVATLAPNVVVLLTVGTAFIHCANSLHRSGLWEPNRWPDTEDMASPARIFRDHMGLDDTPQQMQQSLDAAHGAMT